MKIGIVSVGLGPFSYPDVIAHVACTAEQCGFESLWAPDHSAIPDGHQTKCPYTPDGEIPGGPLGKASLPPSRWEQNVDIGQSACPSCLPAA